MKYLNRLFAFNDERQVNEENFSSATLASSLYSVTFRNFSEEEIDRLNNKQLVTSNSSYKFDQVGENQLVSSITEAHDRRKLAANKSSSSSSESCCVTINKLSTTTTIVDNNRTTTSTTNNKHSVEDSSSSSLVALDNNRQLIEYYDDENEDWILVEARENLAPPAETFENLNYRRKQELENQYRKENSRQLSSAFIDSRKRNNKSKKQMALLDKTGLELIKASWVPARDDQVASGVLLFKGLFTKFPQYLKFFPQFAQLDIENMQENKRLLRHAVKVIETVGFVVDSIGNDSKTEELNEALINLVRGHMKRSIGLQEFRNLGIVLIDFICDINNRRNCKKLASGRRKQQDFCQQLNKSSTGDSINHSSNDDSETMTSILDKVQASSSSTSSSSEDGGFLDGGSLKTTSSTGKNNSNDLTDETCRNEVVNDEDDSTAPSTEISPANAGGVVSDRPNIDTNALVAAWTKLYGSILDLVEREEKSLQQISSK